MLPSIMNWLQSTLFGQDNAPQSTQNSAQQGMPPSQQRMEPNYTHMIGSLMANTKHMPTQGQSMLGALGEASGPAYNEYMQHMMMTRKLQKEQEEEAYERKLQEEKTAQHKHEFENLSAYQKAQIGLGRERMKGGMGRSGLTPQQRVWNSAPAIQKNDMISTAVGMGYSTDEALGALSSGVPLSELAKAKGINIKDVEKVYAPTSSNISQMKSMEGAAAELDVLEDHVTDAAKNYPNTWYGFSPAQVKDALSGLNEDEQARFLASRALQPEIAGARSRIAGGSSAHAALKEVQEKSLGSSKIFSSLVNKNVYEKTQKYINEWLREGVKARKSSIYNTGKKGKEHHLDKNELEKDVDVGLMSDEELMELVK